MKKLLSSLTLFFFIASCASPTVVNIIGPNDTEYSCKKLSDEIAIANQYADEAQKAKKTGTRHNVGALLFFLPGYAMTLKNVDEATQAAKERALHLNKIKDKKNC